MMLFVVTLLSFFFLELCLGKKNEGIWRTWISNYSLYLESKKIDITITYITVYFIESTVKLWLYIRFKRNLSVTFSTWMGPFFSNYYPAIIHPSKIIQQYLSECHTQSSSVPTKSKYLLLAGSFATKGRN